MLIISFLLLLLVSVKDHNYVFYFECYDVPMQSIRYESNNKFVLILFDQNIPSGLLFKWLLSLIKISVRYIDVIETLCLKMLKRPRQQFNPIIHRSMNEQVF